MRILLLFTVLFFNLAHANPINEKCPEFVAHGAPVSSLDQSNTQYLCRTNYAVHYRNDTKTAEWVAERITLEDVRGPAKRKNNFKADSDIPEKFRAELSDYVGTGYDRGHLSPAAANTQNDTIMSESFLLTNVVPQNASKNRGIWRSLELKIRDWVNQGKDIWVVTGTIYEDGYLTIGNDVGVPTYVWKVIYDAKGTKGIAFLFPNEKMSRSELPNLAMSIRDLEATTGINFHPKLPADEESIELAFDISLWSGISE